MLDLSPWVAVPLSGLFLLRARDEVEGWLLFYILGYLVMTYLSFTQVAFVGFSPRFILQLSLPFSVVSALALEKVISIIRLPNVAPLGLFLILIWSLTNPVIKEDQWAVWNDMRQFRDLASGEEILVLGFRGMTDYLKVIGCNVVGKVGQPWEASLREEDRLIAVSLNMPPEYKLKPPCFFEAFRTSMFVAYRPVVGCEPPIFEIISCQFNPLTVRLVCMRHSVASDIALNPDNWVVRVSGIPCNVLKVSSPSLGEIIGPGDELVLEISCQEGIPKELDIRIYGPGGSIVEKVFSCPEG